MKKIVIGILYGIMFGFLTTIIGGFLSFSMFGLIFFANTKLAEILIGSEAFVFFFIVFVISILYWQKKDTEIKNRQFLIPIIIILIEIIFVIGAIYLLYMHNSNRYDDQPIIISTTISEILGQEPGNYSLVVKVKENTITCFCPKNMLCKSCKESGHLIFTDGNDLEVYPAVNDTKNIKDLLIDIDQYYYIVLEKRCYGARCVYYLIDFTSYTV